MSLTIFDFLWKRLTALSRSARIRSSRLRCLYLVYAVSGLSLLTACTSTTLIEGLEIENESVIAVLAKALQEDPFFPDRVRCIFVSSPGKKTINIHADDSFILLKNELIKKNLYQNDEYCRNVDFDEESRSAADPEKFVDSVKKPISVLITTGDLLAKYAGSDSNFKNFLRAHQEYCEENKCDDFYRQKFQFLSVTFSQCRSIYSATYGIGGAVFHTEVKRGGTCIAR